MKLIEVAPVETYSFWNDEQQIVIDEDQSISSTLTINSELSVKVLDGQSLIDVTLSYDTNSQIIRTLKTCPILYLLHNQQYLQQLNLKISPKDCTLMFIGGSTNMILTDEDLKKPVGEYATTLDQLIHFQLSIQIQFIKYDTKKKQSILISHRNVTIRELFDKIEDNSNYVYLALSEAKIILSFDDILSMINETTFFLVKEHHTCLISIKKQAQEELLIVVENDNIKDQQYLIDATIDDIYKQNRQIEQDQYLFYQNDLIPSREMTLNSFLSETTSSIQFDLIHGKLPMNVTVTDEEGKVLVRFQSLATMSIGRVHDIVCQLSKLDKKLYLLKLADDANIDDDFTLEDASESMGDIQFKLISSADVKCLISYQNKTIQIPTTNETFLQVILQQAFQKLQISLNDIDMFKLKVLDDPESPSNVDLETPVEEFRSFFPDTDTILFRLERTCDE